MNDTNELRFCELRHGEGRQIAGVAMRYETVATLPWGREMFRPGAFAPLGNADVILNSSHKRDAPLARTGGGGLELLDDEEKLEIRAQLPQTSLADDVLALVRANVMKGLSIEFRAITERVENNIRIVAKAELTGIGVVDTPAFEESIVQARMKQLATLPTMTRRVWL